MINIIHKKYCSKSIININFFFFFNPVKTEILLSRKNWTVPSGSVFKARLYYILLMIDDIIVSSNSTNWTWKTFVEMSKRQNCSRLNSVSVQLSCVRLMRAKMSYIRLGKSKNIVVLRTVLDITYCFAMILFFFLLAYIWTLETCKHSDHPVFSTSADAACVTRHEPGAPTQLYPCAPTHPAGENLPSNRAGHRISRARRQ